MPDDNSPADVMAMQAGGEAQLRREIEELRAQLSQYQSPNVVETEFGGEAPRYRLNEPGFYGNGLDCSYFEAGKEITYTEWPNLSMVPLNEPARRKMQEHIDYLTECQREKYESAGRKFSGLVTDKGVLIAEADQEARRSGHGPQIVMPTEKGPVPPMLHMAPKRGPGRPRKIVQDVTPETPTPRPIAEPMGFRHKETG